LNYKMVVLDLDGTLLNDKKELTAKNIEVLSQLRARNIEILIATGRRYRYAKKLFENIRFPITILSSGGSMVTNTVDDQRIMTTYLEDNLFHNIVKAGRDHDLYPLLHVDHSEEGFDFLIEFEKDSPCYKSYLTDNVREYRVIRDFLGYTGGRVLLMCFMGNRDMLARFEACLRERFSDRFHSHIMTTLKRIGPVLEIMNPSGTKWSMLREYARILNIKPCEIIAVGDDNNDIEMIKNSGLGVAMKNATGLVKAGAKLITDYTNDEDGVARVLSAVFNLRNNFDRE